MKFWGVVLVVMVYDKLLIIDSFCFVLENMVFGVMDSKYDGDDGIYYFYLKRFWFKL